MIGGFVADLSNTKKSVYTEVNFIRNTYKKRHLLYTLTHSSRFNDYICETAYQACRLYRLYTLKLLCCVYCNMFLLFVQVKQKQRHQQKNGGDVFCFEIYNSPKGDRVNLTVAVQVRVFQMAQLFEVCCHTQIIPVG